MEYQIYDPAHSVGGGYWQPLIQVLVGSEREKWQSIANLVNQGMPFAESGLFRCERPETTHQLWGVIVDKLDYWIYRLFLTGVDKLSRPGRYFFVLFKIDSLDELASVRISSIIQYLNDATGIPLNLEGMAEASIRKDLAESDQSQPNERVALQLVTRECTKLLSGQHVGFVLQNSEILRIHTDLPSLERLGESHVIKEDRQTVLNRAGFPSSQGPPACKQIRNSRFKMLPILLLFFLIAFLVLAVVVVLKFNFFRVESPEPTPKIMPEISKISQPSRGRSQRDFVKSSADEIAMTNQDDGQKQSNGGRNRKEEGK